MKEVMSSVAEGGLQPARLMVAQEGYKESWRARQLGTPQAGGKGERTSKEKLGRAAVREGGPGSVGARVRQREAV